MAQALATGQQCVRTASNRGSPLQAGRFEYAADADREWRHDMTLSQTESHWGLVLLDPDAASDDVPPLFAERGTLPLMTNKFAMPEELPVIHKRVKGDGNRWVGIGLLRGVSPKPDGNLGFCRYESFTTPVEVIPPTDVGVTDQNLELASWPRAELDKMLSNAGKQWGSAAKAREFGQYLSWAFTGTALLRKSADRALREQAPAHHLFHRQVKYWLTEFLAERNNDAVPFQIDTDGLLREGTTRARYTVLGSYVQPATSIVSPFRCAIDYTVQMDPTSGVEIRQGLLDSWAHVASSSYDAAVRVVILRADTPHEIYSYLTLRHIFTRNLLDRLHKSGVYLALLGPGGDEQA